MQKLLEQLSQQFNLEEDEELIDEMSDTGCLDGGEGPPRTPNMFQKKPKSKRDNEIDNAKEDSVPFSKWEETDKWFIKIESILKKVI